MGPWQGADCHSENQRMELVVASVWYNNESVCARQWSWSKHPNLQVLVKC